MLPPKHFNVAEVAIFIPKNEYSENIVHFLANSILKNVYFGSQMQTSFVNISFASQL